MMEFTRDQWVSIFILSCVNVFASAGYSLQGPFYPAEAHRKGASAAAYGLVFGSYELTAFLFSPIAGKMIEKYELRSLMSGGMLLGSTALILFGFVDRIQHTVLFIVVSIMLRIVESLGTCTAAISGFTLLAAMFPKDIGTLFATLEVFYGLGFLLGPTTGGVLYTIGGFSFPFIFIGGIEIMIAILTIILFHQISVDQPQKEEEYDRKSALNEPVIALNLFYVVMYAISIGFYSALLEPHLRQFNLSRLHTSLFFLISGGIYAFTSPILGKLVDKGMKPRTLLVYSCVATILSFTIIGPAPFIPYDATIPSCIIALILQGSAFGAGNVATFTESFKGARDAGYPDSLGTFGLISSLWNASFALGSFLGPVIGGILYDFVGFRWATQFIVGSFLVLLIVIIIFTIATKRKHTSYEEVDGIHSAEDTPLFMHLLDK